MCATQLSFPILQNHHCCFRLLSKTSNEVSEALVKQPVDKWIYSHTEPTHIDRELAPDWEHDPRRDPACMYPISGFSRRPVSLARSFFSEKI